MKKLLYLVLCIAFVGFNSCSDDEDIKLPDVSVNFAASEVGFDSNDASEELVVNLSRVSTVAITAEITIVPSGVEYTTHFTTTPATSNNKISVTIPAGENSAAITVNKAVGILLEGDESVKFTITALSVSTGVKIGAKPEAVLTFGSIVSAGQTMTLEGNGSEAYINSVYVDLSTNKQAAINRKSWNLGFYCGDDFKVIINGAYATAATPSTKTDITAVTIADANAVADDKNLNVNPMGGTFSETIFDAANGALDKTAFTTISATDAENMVYFVASADQKTSNNRGDWYKVKVSRKGEGYTVQYGKVSETTVKTVDVPKKEGYNFTFLSLEQGKVVDVEPQAAKWDIKWSYDAGLSTSANPLYIFMQDFVSINNHGGTSIALVMTEDIAYSSFAASDISKLSFEKTRDAVGATWRTVGMSGAGGVKTDRFYVVKDPAGNHYKLRFTKMGVNNDGAVRGRPEIEYALVK